jgi:C-terminal processing protease CtpA/Prc
MRCVALTFVLSLGCFAPARRPAVPKVAAAPDQVPFGPDDRASELAFLRDVIRETYSHLDTKRSQWGTDLDEIFARYQPLIRRADTWDRYERVMAGFASEFHDAHLAWRRRRAPSEKRRRIVRLGLSTRFAGGMLIVDDVWAGSGAEKAGLRVGDRVVGIDGETVEARLGGLGSLRSWSRREDARYDFAEEWPAQRVDEGAPPPERRVTRELDDGTYQTVRVAPETQPPAGWRKPALELQREGTVAILRVRDLSGRLAVLEQRMAAVAVELFAEPRGLVVDLRGDAGGFDKAARVVVGRLCAQPVVGGELRVRLSARARTRSEWRELAEDPARPGWSTAVPLRAEPQAQRPYPARIAVLIDAGCRSSCESLALLLRAAGARLFGERTGGSSGAPLTIELPKSRARVTIPAWAMFDPGGQPIEGRGVAPDEEIAPSRADLVAHRDSALERATAFAATPP